MGGFFGAISRKNCKYDIFFGTDYHSHLGAKRGGLAVYDAELGFQRQIHNIENTPFRTKFESDLKKMDGTAGVGIISDSDPQPLLVRSHLGMFAVAVVGLINNAEDIVAKTFAAPGHYFMAMSSGKVNSAELIAALINRCDNFVDGIKYTQELVEGSCTILLLTPDGLIVARDKMGRLPIVIGQSDTGCCAALESFACQKLGYTPCYNPGPGEIVKLTAEGYTQLAAPGDKMKICAFLWSYYGYPNSNYEGQNVEVMRCRNGEIMAREEQKKGLMPDVDDVAGVPDSGLPHAIGYANFSHKPFARPFVKYTPTWARSFTPSNQEVRNLVAEMKQIPVPELIQDKKLLLVDDSIVRGTQLHETVDFLYRSGAKEVHMRSACPPIMYSCKYLNFSRSNSDMELLTRRTIQQLEGAVGQAHLEEYADPATERGQKLLNTICTEMGFDSLGYQTLDGLLEAIGLDKDKVCTYCWTGKE